MSAADRFLQSQARKRVTTALIADRKKREDESVRIYDASRAKAKKWKRDHYDLNKTTVRSPR